MRDRVSQSSLLSLIKLASLPLAIFLVFMMIWLKSQITSLEYTISELEAQKLQTLQQKKELIVQRSDMLAIKNVEYIAKNRLGLTFPDRKKVIYVKRGEQSFNFKAGYRSDSR